MTESVERAWSRAREYLATEQYAAARVTLESLLADDPQNTEAHLLLGGIAWKENRRLDALRHAHDAARVVPDDGTTLLSVIAALIQIGECTMARDLLDRPFFAGTHDGEVLAQAASLHQMIEDHEGSLALYERARAAGCDDQEFHFNLSNQLSFNGRLREAEEELERCLGSGKPLGKAYVNLSRLRRQTPEHNHLEAIEQVSGQVQPGSEDQAALEFARYKELEDLGRHDEAWNALAKGNALMAARTAYDAPRKERLLEDLRKLCTANFVGAGRQFAQDGPAPIFIVGMTRSGTTVLDRILGNHSQVRSAGEIKDFGAQLAHVTRQCTQRVIDRRMLDRLADVSYAEVGARYLAQTQWRARGRRFYVDKFPPNWQVAGLIHRALPQARIVHLVRSPMDVCFSNFRAFFGQSYVWSYDVDRLAHYYLQYRRTMAHWHEVMPGQVLNVGYSDLVRDPEATARQVFDFCGLDYEEGCVDLTRNEAAVASWSMAQVRQSIHASAFDEWRPYATQLVGLRTAVRLVRHAVDGPAAAPIGDMGRSARRLH